MAARGLSRRCAHTFSEEALAVRLYGAVVLGDDVPAWLRLPCWCPDSRGEQVRSGHGLSGPNQLLFLRGKAAREGIHAFRKQPNAPVGDFDVREDVRLGKLGRLRLRRFV